MKILPRFSLTVLPTPLQRAGRLERALGSPPLYIKRDDLTGFCVGGNKARKLEFLVAEALARGSGCLLTGGGQGSNHCAATAAAARVAGLDCIILYYGTPPEHPHPNLSLARHFGAEVRFTQEADRASVDQGLDDLRSTLEREGRRPFMFPRGGATPLGAAAYAFAVGELAWQLREASVEPAALVVANGSGGTQAGIVAGAAAGGHRWQVIGASVSRPPDEARQQVTTLAASCAQLMKWGQPGSDLVDVRDARGPGYGIPSPEGAAAARLAAETEGLLLDPVFTAKALGVLIALVDARTLDGPAVFWHTGGLVAALAEVEQ